MTARAPLAAKNNLSALPTAGESCPMVDFVNLVSGKWAIPILYRLIMIDGPVRFSELQRAGPAAISCSAWWVSIASCC